jgi:soluble lytic murein transglycosylase
MDRIFTEEYPKKMGNMIHRDSNKTGGRPKFGLKRGRSLPTALLLGAMLVLFAGGMASAADAAFVEAYQKQDFRALARYAPAYKNTPLEPYLFARMVHVREAVLGPLSRTVARDLDRFEGVLPVEKLRAALVKEWARQGEWKQVALHGPRIPDWLSEKDGELRCVLLELAQMQHRPAADERKTLFSQMHDFPSACSTAFAGTVSAGEIAPESVMLKIMHLASFKKSGPAERLARMLEPELRQTSPLKGSAATVISVLSTARDDVSAGIELLEVSKPVLASETLRALTVHVGIIASRKLDLRAHGLIASVNGYQLPLDRAAAEWRTRAAIAASSWSDILASIEHMAPMLRDEPAWQFWQARALQKLGKRQEAALLFSRLAGQQSGYYGILAAEQTGTSASYKTSHYPVDHAYMRQLAENPSVKRALALHDVGLWSEAAHEWRILMRRASSAQYYAAARFAQEHGLIDRQIYLAGKAVDHVDLQLQYPPEHRREVISASEDAGIAPEWAWAVIRQESRFIPHAVSSAGAVGLMQLMPATAKKVAARVRLGVSPTRQVLMTPRQNIVLGTAFLGSLLRKYDGNYAYASAAYNAGPGRVDKWRVKLGGVDCYAFVELIPFEETRDYTKRVLANSIMYGHVTGKQPIRLGGFLSAQVR